MGSERHTRARARMSVLSASRVATFDSKLGDGLAAFADSCKKIGMFGGEMDMSGALKAVIEHNRHHVEAGQLTENPSWRNILQNFLHPIGLACWLSTSPLPEWDPTQFGCNEQGMVDAIEFYHYDTVSALYIYVLA